MVVAAAIARLRQDLGLQQSVKAWRDSGLNLTSFMPSVSSCALFHLV